MSEDCANFLSSSDKAHIRSCHEAQGHAEINPPGLPPGSSSKLAFANAIGAERFVREYGFDGTGQVVVIVETRGRKIDREAFLASCRNTSQWYWELRIQINDEDIEKQWHPVPTIPANSLTRNPQYHRNGETVHDADAFCVSFRNGNHLVGYDQSWTADPGDARALALPDEREANNELEFMGAYLDQLDDWSEERTQ